MRSAAEVLEFIIVPPYHRRDAVAAAERRLSEYLENKFRGYSFRIAGFAPVGDPDDEDFHVLPVMNFIDDEGVSRMCEPPKSWMMSQIADACREFDFERKRYRLH